MRSRGAMSNRLRIVSSSSAEGGVFRYSIISGSMPCSRSRLTACLDLLQRGLCQTVIPKEMFLLTGHHRATTGESKQAERSESGSGHRVQGAGPAVNPEPCALVDENPKSEIRNPNFPLESQPIKLDESSRDFRPGVLESGGRSRRPIPAEIRVEHDIEDPRPEVKGEHLARKRPIPDLASYP